MSGLADLNRPEPKWRIIRRLAKEAGRRKRGLPSTVAAVEFRREQYGLSARAFAAVLGMAASHYSEFVHGKRGLPHAAMCRAYAIGVPAECLLQPLRPMTTRTRGGQPCSSRATNW